jgi:hypothetical protein
MATGVAAIVSLALAPAPGSAHDSFATAEGESDPRSCRYIYEWIDFARFPVQPTNGWATYTYLVQSRPQANEGYVMRGKFPHGTYASWAIYDDELTYVDGMTASEMHPDPGSQNPFRRGRRMLAENRHFRLLMAPELLRSPENTPPLAPRFRSIRNKLEIPTNSGFWIMVVRVYGALENFNRGGYRGRDGDFFPRTVAVDLESGKKLDCPLLSVLDYPDRSVADMPSGASGAHHQGFNLIPSLGEKLFLGGPTVPPVRRDTPADDLLDEGTCDPPPPQEAASDDSGFPIYQCAPTFDEGLIQFSRPPVGPGAAPAEDECSGYLGAAIDPKRIGLLRIPRIPTFLSNTGVTPHTRYRQKQVQFYGLTMYGADLGIYLRHDTNSPYSNSIGNEEFLPDRSRGSTDRSRGSTILLWPRDEDDLDESKRRRLFRHAKRNGWAVMRSGLESLNTTANLLLREKGVAPRYQYSYLPQSESGGRSAGVPCYFDDDDDDDDEKPRWLELQDEFDKHPELIRRTYIANPSNMGPAAPQGVYCSFSETLNGTCKNRLRQYIESTGGRWRY